MPTELRYHGAYPISSGETDFGVRGLSVSKYLDTHHGFYRQAACYALDSRRRFLHR
jgi:hypothetical protein